MKFSREIIVSVACLLSHPTTSFRCYSVSTANRRFARSLSVMMNNDPSLSQGSQDAPTPPPSEKPPLALPQKFHHFTICMVPPESNQRAWEELAKARMQLKDPGFFRWPPHANLLYPFIYPFHKAQNSVQEQKEEIISTSDSTQQEQPSRTESLLQLQPDVLEGLRTACAQIEPFTVRLDRLGTFGGAKRGVLWLYPTSFHGEQPTIDEPSRDQQEQEEEPLIRLQSLLQESFPYCSEQQKQGGTFNPHMTLSHFVDLESALAAQAEVELWWDSSISFPVNEVYLLYRKGDGGQFERLATISVGKESHVQVHIPTLPFHRMPNEEAEWVHEERMKLKQRRNQRGSRGCGQRKSRTGRTRSPPDTPEVIAQKRAERRAKREARERELAQNSSADS